MFTKFTGSGSICVAHGAAEAPLLQLSIDFPAVVVMWYRPREDWYELRTQISRDPRADNALCLLATGCLPYAYPKLSYVPGTELGPEVSDVHAFRLDAATDVALFQAECVYELTEITPRAGRNVPSQLRVTVERRVAHPTDQFYFFSGGCVHETLVRLYRPGYRLVELKSWDSTDKIAWQRAPDWGSQRETLLGLLAPPNGRPVIPHSLANASTQSVHDWVWHHSLPLAPTTPQTQRVFDVAVAECERLEKSAPTSEDVAMIRDLAQKLIEWKSAASKSIN